MADPKALGMVLAMLVDGKGKPVRGGSGKGQLYVSADGIVVLRPAFVDDLWHRLALAALLLSVMLVIVNAMVLKTLVALWIALALQVAYWVTLPRRRRSMEPQRLDAAGLEAAAKAGRAIVRLPAGDVVRAVAPEPPKRGFRKPARFELADGALEVWLSEDAFRAAMAALGGVGGAGRGG
jgi:hypothetical protein